MKATLRPGVTRVESLAVDHGRTIGLIGFIGDEARTYSTPSMVERLKAKAARFAAKRA